MYLEFLVPYTFFLKALEGYLKCKKNTLIWTKRLSDNSDKILFLHANMTIWHFEGNKLPDDIPDIYDIQRSISYVRDMKTKAYKISV